MKFGLKKDTIEKINAVFANYPSVDQVVLYGSRAKGNFEKGSDIDFTLKGKGLNLSVLQKIELELDDLMLPYTIDLSIFLHISNSDLIDHINRVGRIFYEKRETLE